MSHALPRPGHVTRGSLFGLVLGLHAGALMLILAAKSVAPLLVEKPLFVDLLPTQDAPKPQETRPLPMARPHAVRPPATPVPAMKSVPKALETTTTALPAPTAPAPSVSAPPPGLSQASATTAEPVSQARFDVESLHNPAPPYPPLSRRMQEEGRVILRVAVNPQGLPDSVEIRASSGSARLDESAQKTVRNWKFIPARRGETAITSWVLVPIIFKLES